MKAGKKKKKNKFGVDYSVIQEEEDKERSPMNKKGRSNKKRKASNVGAYGLSSHNNSFANIPHHQ